MIPDGATIPDGAAVPEGPAKRKRGDIRVELAVSAFVLLAPPLGMAAGVMYLGTPLQYAGQQGAALQAAVAGDTPVSVAERSDMRPDGAANFALASAAQHPVIAEQRPVAVPAAPATMRPVTEPPVAAAQRPAGAQANGQTTGTKDSARYHGAAPVTLVHGGTAGDQAPTADVGAPPSTAKTAAAPAADTPAADAPAAVPEQSPAAAQMPHSARKVARHEARKQHSPSLADIFLRPAGRPRTTPRGSFSRFLGTNP
jgi:hypothetical protein